MTKPQVNAYFATLLIVVAGIGAGIIIWKVAVHPREQVVKTSSEASYAPLQNSILNGDPSTGGQ